MTFDQDIWHDCSLWPKIDEVHKSGL